MIFFKPEQQIENYRKEWKERRNELLRARLARPRSEEEMLSSFKLLARDAGREERAV